MFGSWNTAHNYFLYSGHVLTSISQVLLLKLIISDLPCVKINRGVLLPSIHLSNVTGAGIWLTQAVELKELSHWLILKVAQVY